MTATRPMTRDEYRDRVAADMLEDALQTRVLALAKETGWLAYHTHDSRRSQPGFPDLTLVHAKRRRFLMVELKTVRGRVSPDQHRWLTALAAANVETHVWRPHDLLDGTIAAVLTAPREVNTDAT